MEFRTFLLQLVTYRTVFIEGKESDVVWVEVSVWNILDILIVYGVMPYRIRS
jgi:hypothetical protein